MKKTIFVFCMLMLTFVNTKAQQQPSAPEKKNAVLVSGGALVISQNRYAERLTEFMCLPYDRTEAEESRRSVREFVARVANKHGMSSRNYKAFVMHVLDEFTPDEIVDQIWGRGVSAAKRVQYKGDLYVIKSRMLAWLRKEIKTFEAA